VTSAPDLVQAEDMEGYRGLAAAILLNALSNYSCEGASCEKVTAAGRKYPAVQRAICVNCQRDAEGFLYSDWCNALLEWLNLDQELLTHAMDNPESTAKLHKMKAKHRNAKSARHPASDMI